jgi:transcriptional regulator with XRE-family HTH domain
VTGCTIGNAMSADPAIVHAPALPDIERTVSALGTKVAAARADRGWSLAELGRRAGMSPAAVHKIEKSGMTPTIASLMKIAAALGKSVAHFVEEDAAARPALVIRGGARSRLFTSKSGLVLENVSGRYGPFALAGAEATVEPHASSGPDPMNHPGEELLVLQEGAMRFTVDGEVFELEAGDSIHFRTNRPHSWCNPGDVPARAIWLVVRSS